MNLESVPRVEHPSQSALRNQRMVEALVAATAPEAFGEAAVVPECEADWVVLVELAGLHCVNQLLRSGVERLGWPGTAGAAFRALRERCAARAMFGVALTAELRRLLNACASAQLQVMPLKGPCLAELAYPDPLLREYADLDLLVRPAQLPQAIAALQACGYHSPYRNNRPDRAYHQVFHHPRLRTTVELHWRIAGFEYGAFNSGEFLWERARENGADDCRFWAPAAEDLLIYLAIHAFKHYWERLQWVHDVPRLLAACPHLDWTVLWQRSRDWGCLRIVQATMQLAAQVYPDVMPAAARPAESPLHATQLARIRQAWAELEPLHPGGWQQLRMKLPLLDSGADRWRFVYARIRPSEQDMDWINLPRWLYPLYPLVRPVRVCWQYLRGDLPRRRPRSH